MFKKTHVEKKISKADDMVRWGRGGQKKRRERKGLVVLSFGRAGEVSA